MSESGDTGAGFVIQDLQITKSYYLGKHHSIFTAELIAILMALNNILAMPKQFYSILFCVDSQSVLQSLSSSDPKERSDIIFEIKHYINCLMSNGTIINFCWVPSHCGLRYNEYADYAAKRGANNIDSQFIDVPYSLKEKYNIIGKKYKVNVQKSNILELAKGYSRRISSLAYRLYLNAWSTKFCPEIMCTCNEKITLNHIMFHCRNLTQLQKLVNVKDTSEIDFKTWLNISVAIMDTTIEQYL